MNKIKSCSEQEHEVEEDDFLETSDLSPHTIVIDHEHGRKYNDTIGAIDKYTEILDVMK